ncbi:MAG: hypothetical protein NUV65_05505 [Candidatus Roizmanbacteria bacterium]|nr:hypothetical protein [Candidatus Roizmanbacteria bacterium]
MNTATIIPILAFIGISGTLLYQIVQYLKYKKKHKKPNIPSLKQNSYVVDPKKFIENIDRHAHEETISITRNKQKLKMAYYAIVSIFIVFVGAVVLFTRNNNITYIPRAQTNQNPTSTIPTQNAPILPTKTNSLPATTDSTSMPTVTKQPTITIVNDSALSPTKTSTPITLTPTSSFRALLSRTPTPSTAPSPTATPTKETITATRIASSPTHTNTSSTHTPTVAPTYLAYAVTQEPTQLALATRIPTTQITHIETITPKAIPSTGFIENSIILFLAGSAFLLIGFLF